LSSLDALLPRGLGHHLVCGRFVCLALILLLLQALVLALLALGLVSLSHDFLQLLLGLLLLLVARLGKENWFFIFSTFLAYGILSTANATGASKTRPTAHDR